MKKFSLTTAYVIIAGLFVAGIGTAVAFTVPGNPPAMPNPNIFEPITTSATGQSKIGGIVAKSLIAGSGIAANPSAPVFAWDSYVMAKTLAAAPYGLFMSDHSLVAGTSSKVKIGGTAALSAPLIPSQNTTPLTLDLAGRTASASTARNAQEFISGNSCNVSIGTNTGAIRFVDNQTPAGNDNDSHTINVIGRQVRLSGGNAAPLRVLVATNTKGDAVWGTMTIENGAVKVNYDRSPVTDVQACSTPPSGPVLGCMDPTASNYNPSATQDNGSCIHTCPAGQSWDSTQRACTCDAGIREGMLPNGNIATTGKIITYLDGVNQNPGGSGAPLVPYYVVLHELRRNGGPGNSCQIKAWDAACPAFDLDTQGDLTSFVLDGTTYRTTEGNSWKIDYQVGDQCIMNQRAQTGSGLPLTIMNIER